MKSLRSLPFARFSNLTRPDDQDIYQSFHRMAELLEGSGIEGTFQFGLYEGTDWKRTAIRVTRAQAHVIENANVNPDFEILCKKEVWEQIAAGTRSPLDAFTKGELRVRGDYKFGPRILGHLASEPGRIDIC